MQPELQALKVLVTEKIGLVVRDEDRNEFSSVISGRLKRHHLGGLAEYEELLRAGSSRSRQEWNALTALLTVGESYFFRDTGQFGLLREHILPRLIARGKGKRMLGIWSAGCATGEETYSLAMVIDGLLPDRANWQLRIIGSDIDEQAIAKAKRGIFGDWSFRTMSQGERARYFTQRSDGWEISERIRRMVDFRVGNLLDAGSEPVDIENAMDLIVCRNVFIYFTREAIAHAMKRLVKALAPGGFLMTGHGELMRDRSYAQGLTAQIHPESVVYRKTSDHVAPGSEAKRHQRRLIVHWQGVGGPVRGKRSVTLKDVSATRPSRCPLQLISSRRTIAPPEQTGQTSRRELSRLFRSKHYRSVIEVGERVIRADSRNWEAYELMARACANQGLYEKAADLCSTMMELDDRSPTPHFLMAHIAQAQGDYEAAKKLLKKALYLDPTFVPAYVDLSGIYARENDTKRAMTNCRTAVELLALLPPNTVIDRYESVTAGELIRYCKEMLG